tara:strand:+ start:67 stop:543 length:477 start_codon:yes stop_codon:yes gene_type:complete
MTIRKNWSLDRDTVNSDEVNALLEKFEWDLFPATYANYGRVPKLPGIYIFRATKNINLSKKELSTIVYVGISENDVSVRYYDHRTKPWFDDGWKCFKSNFTFSAWFPDKEFLDKFESKYELKKELERLETCIIDAFGPIVNDKRSHTTKTLKSKLKKA